LNNILLVTGDNCPLCKKAKDKLNSIEDLFFEEVDIYKTREYHEKYWDKIPVLLYDDKELFWPFDENQIVNLLSS